MADFTYRNINPYNIAEEDCVCRAISTTTGLKYYAVEHLLDLTAKTHKCPKLCVCCYHHLLEDILEYPVFYADNETVSEIADKFNRNKVIIRINGHLTCSIYGTIVDLWDSSNKLVDCYWIVENNI